VNSVDVILTPKESLVADISTPPQEQHFDDTPDIEAGNVELRIGRGPILRDLTEESYSSGRPLDEELKYLEDRFRVLLLTTSLSVLRIPGRRTISQLQYTLDFDTKTEVAIIDMLPKSEIVEAGKMELGTKTEVSAEVDAKGQLGVVLPAAGVSASAHIGTHNRAAIVANFQYVIYAVRTVAIGQYGKTGIWNFVADGKPLVGDFVFATTLLVDKLMNRRLKCNIKIAVTLHRFGLFPEKRVSAWVPLEFELPRRAVTM
jgi:hypothetical protein